MGLTLIPHGTTHNRAHVSQALYQLLGWGGIMSSTWPQSLAAWKCRKDQKGTDLTLTGRGEQKEDPQGKGLGEFQKWHRSQHAGHSRAQAEVEMVNSFCEGLRGLQQGV